MATIPINLDKKIDPETYIFTFGKHEGESFLDVLTIDANYLVWCIENVRFFMVDRHTEDTIYDEAYEQDTNDEGFSELDFG